jgi:hypothetical protein
MIMKKENLTNKIINRFFYVCLSSLLGLTFTVAFANAQTDLKKTLAGEDSKKWELRDVKLIGKTYHEEEFNDNDEFELKNEAAQLVPETIVFNADGTCEMTYVSQYKDGKIVEGDYTVRGKWSIEGDTVEIIENANADNKLEESRDEVFWLKDVVVSKNGFRCKFEMQGDYTGGVEELGYELEGGTDSDEKESDSEK